MATIGLVHFPGHGHLRGPNALAAALVDRGHRVVCWTLPGYEAGAEEAGAEVVVLRPDLDPDVVPTSIPEVATLIAEGSAQAIGMLRPLLREARCDVVIHDSMALWGRVAALVEGVPTVCAMSTVYVGGRPGSAGEALEGALDLARGARWLPRLRRALRAIRRQHDVDPGGLLDVMSNPGDRTLVFSAATLTPRVDAVPPEVRFVGPCAATADPDAVEAALARLPGERPLVYVTLGTVFNENAAHFRAVLDGLADEPVEVLVATGGPLDLGPLPSNAVAAEWVAQGAVLARARAAVVHGGMTTTHDALLAGVPMLVVPYGADQPLIARRLEAAGAGLRLREPRPDAVRDAVRRLLREPSFAEQAARLGDALRAAPGIDGAVAEVEALLAR